MSGLDEIGQLDEQRTRDIARRIWSSNSTPDLVARTSQMGEGSMTPSSASWRRQSANHSITCGSLSLVASTNSVIIACWVIRRWICARWVPLSGTLGAQIGRAWSVQRRHGRLRSRTTISRSSAARARVICSSASVVAPDSNLERYDR